MNLLKANKAIKLPGKKHDKWRLANGFMFIASKSPSDHRAKLNELAELRRALGRSPWLKSSRFS